MQYLQLVNDVLKALREDQVDSVAESEYSELIGRFVNQAKAQVERKWGWSVLRQNLGFDTVVDVDEGYSVTGIGKSFRELSVFNVTDQSDLRKASSTWIARQRKLTTVTKGAPTYYAFRGLDANGDMKVDIWPTPDKVYTIDIEVQVPQDDLSADIDTLSIPEWPVRLKAYELALRERGEDDGLSWQEIREDYITALNDEIALDTIRNPGETNWEVE